MHEFTVLLNHLHWVDYREKKIVVSLSYMYICINGGRSGGGWAWGVVVMAVLVTSVLIVLLHSRGFLDSCNKEHVME